ncbi:helix-turn-helix domain-containing protein [Streptomonospora salina]|uniref:helix-turn-helix domain-containing protein n=1 Tax=Streptomonospora salina TaxID=104205 RepID=UPI0016204EE5|nr:helix-turn-helix transcriptional regulator [Streptomonospora salina]
MSREEQARWSRFGDELRKSRSSAGMTQRDLGSKVGLSHGMVGAIERAQRRPQKEQVEDFDTILATGGVLSQIWDELTTEWNVPAGFRDVLHLEQRSRQIREFNAQMLPGILQTPDYARALIRARKITASKEEVDHLVETRVGRLAKLREGSLPLLWCVVRQAALTPNLGDSAIVRGQLAHLIKLGTEGTARIQIIPDSAPAPAALCEAFRVMTLDGANTIGYVEHALGGEVKALPQQVEDLITFFETLLSEALSPSASLELIGTINGDHHGEMD